MKKIKVVPIIISAAILIGIVGLILYIVKVTRDEYSLTISEKKWIESNKNIVIDVSIMNDLPIFANEGKGIAFSFLDYFSVQTGLEFNKKSYSTSSDLIESDYVFKILDYKESITKNDLLFYKDNYVVLSKNNEIISNLDEIYDKKIGALVKDVESISNYIKSKYDFTFSSYDSATTMLSKFESGDLDYIILPKNQFLNVIIQKNYYVSYQFNNLFNKYVLSYNVNNKKLNSIFYKLFNKWYKTKYNNLYIEMVNDYYYKLSGITEKERAAFKSRVYVYGYIDNLPYDYTRNRKLYGINNEFLKSFAAFSGIQFEYKKYSNVKALQKAIDDGFIDISFNYYSFNDLKGVNYSTPIYSGEYVVLSHEKNNIAIDYYSLLKDHKINMMKDTLLYKYISNDVANIKQCSKIRQLIKDKSLIVIDLNTYNYYKNSKLKDYYIVYKDNIDINYNYIIKSDSTNDVFTKIFQFYLTNVNRNEVRNNGMYELSKLGNFANISYIYYVLLIIVVIIFSIIVVKKRRIMEERKIQKIKYIDSLTSLKNRSYLVDNMSKWDLNKTFPKAIVVVDLNKLKEVNNNYGYDEGDLLIKKAANILINTQEDNTDIIRTDGDEFTIYMVGYQESQVVQYIRKIYKLMQDLPYEYGSTLGYSMINDDVKTVEDAINEAVLDMITNKEIKANE